MFGSILCGLPVYGNYQVTVATDAQGQDLELGIKGFRVWVWVCRVEFRVEGV